MNDLFIEILSARPDFNLSIEDKKLLDFFAEYLDHGSLFLAHFEPGTHDRSSTTDPVFIFTNDAQRYRFSMSEIREHVQSMKRGIAMDWERLPFEMKEPTA